MSGNPLQPNKAPFSPFVIITYEMLRSNRFSIISGKVSPISSGLASSSDSFRQSSVRGGTVYTLSESSSDREAELLAQKENRSDLIAGIDLRNETDEVTSILIDLARRETMNYSARFTNLLLPELSSQIRMRRNSHRFAAFEVLKAPDVPSVLLEAGYLTNRDDARNLNSAAGRRKISKAVQRGVDAYFATLKAEGY